MSAAKSKIRLRHAQRQLAAFVTDTNGRLFDPKIKMWNSTNASAHMCFGDQGPYREIYHRTGPSANISFYIADPADDYWQNLFVSIAKELRQAGVE